MYSLPYFEMWFYSIKYERGADFINLNNIGNFIDWMGKSWRDNFELNDQSFGSAAGGRKFEYFGMWDVLEIISLLCFS